MTSSSILGLLMGGIAVTVGGTLAFKRHREATLQAHRLKLAALPNPQGVYTIRTNDEYFREKPRRTGRLILPCRRYTVKPGDSLEKISTTTWNTPRGARLLYELNRGTLSSQDQVLTPGQVLLILDGTLPDSSAPPVNTVTIGAFDLVGACMS